MSTEVAESYDSIALVILWHFAVSPLDLILVSFKNIQIMPTSDISADRFVMADILLGGDASHHQALYLPVPTDSEDLRSPLPVIDGKPQLAIKPELATYTIGQLTRMSKEDNVMVILAHEGQVDGVVDQYPGDLSQWKQKGWKAKKEEGVTREANARRSN